MLRGKNRSKKQILAYSTILCQHGLRGIISYTVIDLPTLKILLFVSRFFTFCHSQMTNLLIPWFLEKNYSEVKCYFAE